MRFPAVARRVRAAMDAEGLWNLRSTVMSALCDVHGESAARSQMAELSQLFDGILRGGLSSRPSPLER